MQNWQEPIKGNYAGLILGLLPANETALLCNDVSHWLGASLESALDAYLQLGHSELMFSLLSTWLMVWSGGLDNWWNLGMNE